MTESTQDTVQDLTGSLRDGWHRFLDVYEPLRPELFRYCRYLTHSPWDAEDLAQDTLARAFVTLGCMFEPPRSARGWLFRVASNLWIDRQRQERDEPGPVPEQATEPEPRAPREAAGTLLSRLSPQERAAIVLKDVFGLSLEETAEAVSTTVGAVKAALHRGRGKLLAPESPASRLPAPAVLDAFCAAFNARDVERALATMHPEVDWPNGMEGGYVRGHAAVRDYWTRQWRLIDPYVEPRRFTIDGDGRIVAHVHQIVRDLSGGVVTDQMIQHVYLIENGAIRHMEIWK